jgi:serine/threonine protein kinase
MELIAGSTVAERVAKGPLPIREVLTIATQVAEALETAHEKHIVHRDLKPANIALTPAGSVKVLDFGLARIARPLDAAISEQPTIAASATQAGAILGTTAYMSPEQTRGQPVDERTDIWSFGCVLYEMLTGRPPFTGRTMSDTMAAVLRSEPDWTALAGKTPPRVQDLIRRCLRHDLGQRLHSIADARIELADALTQASPAARRRSRVAIAVSCAAIVAVVGMVWLWRQDRPQLAAKLDITPFTTFVGEERAPAFSPDGTTLAFTWNQGSGPDLYVKLVGGADPLRLTTQGDVADPAWSPGGHEIAFLRRLG